MKTKLKTALAIISLLLAVILIKSCSKNPSASSCASCQLSPDAMIPAKFESALGGVNFNTEVYYTSLAKNECEIGLANGISREIFAKILSAVMPLLDIQSSSDQRTVAFTIYRNGELHLDSSIRLKDIVGISRYYTKNGKLFHQLFVKNFSDNKFTELTDLSAEIDGVIFNYMHQIGKGVLNIQSSSTAFFFKTEDTKGLYHNLKNPHDDLKWKLKIYFQKKKLHSSSLQQEQYETANCGNPCKKNDGTVCRNGDLVDPGNGSDYVDPGNARCGPNPGPCPSVLIFTLLSDSLPNPPTIQLPNGARTLLENCINLDNLRTFRDSVLYRSDLGLRYINNYYMLGDRLNSVIDFSTALTTASVGFDVNNAINTLMTPTSDATTILITSAFKTELVDLLNLYKSKTSDPEAITAIDGIISDMNSFEGKTVAQMRVLLNM
jgi:hypothetical protein